MHQDQEGGVVLAEAEREVFHVQVDVVGDVSEGVGGPVGQFGHGVAVVQQDVDVKGGGGQDESEKVQRSDSHFDSKLSI